MSNRGKLRELCDLSATKRKAILPRSTWENLRAMLRRGVKPIKVADANAEAAGNTSQRFTRGNISLQRKPAFTRKDLNDALDRRKARILEQEGP